MSTESILEGILSPKVVNDGNGGYTTKTDIVNVDNITATGTLTAASVNAAGGDFTLHNINATGSISANGGITAGGGCQFFSATFGIGNPGDPFNIRGDGVGGGIMKGDISLDGKLYGGNDGTQPVVIGTDLQLNTGNITSGNNNATNITIYPSTTFQAQTTIFPNNILVGGTISGSFLSTQCGTGQFSSSIYVTITPTSAALLTANAVILVTPTSTPTGTLYIKTINPGVSFQVFSTATETSTTFNYFIAKF